MIVDDKPNLNDGSADEQVQPKDDFGNFFCKLHLAFETWILILPLLAKVQLCEEAMQEWNRCRWELARCGNNSQLYLDFALPLVKGRPQ